MEDLWLRYSFVSEEFLTVEEAREWVFCIAYFLQETTIVIKTKEIVETKKIEIEDEDDAVEIEELELEEKEIEREGSFDQGFKDR